MKIDPKISSRSARAVSNENLENTPKLTEKSSKIDARSLSGALRERLLALWGARSSDSGRLGATRAALRATRSVQVGRSGSLGVGRVGRVARDAPSALAVIRIEILILILILI